MPKPTYVNHPARYSSNVSEQIPYFVKKMQPVQYQPQPQSQPQHQPKAHYHNQSYTFRPEPYIQNQSVPVQQVRPNYHSRVELRGNSSEKNIKENNHKHPLTQSYMESSFNHLSTPQLDGSKKIRKSGLTVLRAVDN